MGKEHDQEVKETEQPKEEPKKGIKKLPFKMFSKGKKRDGDEDLKSWKPMKIAETIEQHQHELQK